MTSPAAAPGGANVILVSEVSRLPALALADPGTRDSLARALAADHPGSGLVPTLVGRGDAPAVNESPVAGPSGEGEAGLGSADLPVDVAPVGLATPVGSDLIGEFSLPPVVDEVAAAVERFAVRVEDEVAGDGETWVVAIGLAAVAGEVARRQLRRETRRRKPDAGRWGDGHAL